MNDQDGAARTITYDNSGDSMIQLSYPDQMILLDENEQPWAITVRPDGQLQTAKYPDGQPMTISDYADKSLMNALMAWEDSPASAMPKLKDAFKRGVRHVVPDQSE